jgi:F-type H+-transporting ATPase subunit delta
MQNPRLASRYAKALIDIAKEQNVLDLVLIDITLIKNTVKSSRDLAVILHSPVIKSDKKIEIFKAIFGTNLQQVTFLFINLLMNKGREANLVEIAESYIKQYNELNKINTVKVTTAAPMDDELKAVIMQKIQEQVKGEKVEIITDVQPELIGGFVLQIGDKFFDASVRRDLNDVKHQFTKNIYVADI